MTVRAANNAFFDLALKLFKRGSLHDEIGDFRRLVSHVIEFEDHGIGLATVDAGVLAKISEDVRDQLISATRFSRANALDRASNMARVPASGIGALAKKADPPMRLAFHRPQRKLNEGSCLAAHTASPGL